MNAPAILPLALVNGSGLTLALLIMVGLGVGVIVVVVLAVVAACRSGSGGRKARLEETRLIQETHEGMMDLGKRIETLETLLLDHSRSTKEDTSHDRA